MRKTKTLYFVVAFVLIPVSLLAFDLSRLRINGFVSQGYMKTSGNDWLATDSSGGTTQINEVGLTFNLPVDDKLRIGMQFLSRDLGDEGNNNFQLDWAFGDYRVNDAFGVRLGKVKMPIGLYNEGRDSDFLRNMAFLPQSVYDETRRNLLVASQGGQIYGNLTLGNAGDLDYQAHYGQINFSDDSPTMQAFLQFAQQADMMFNGADPNVLTNISADNKSVYGAALRYNTPLEGLRLGLSYFEGEADFKVSGYNVATNKSYANMLRVSIQDMFVGSLEYSHPWFTFAAEYTQFEQPAWYQGQYIAPVPNGNTVGYYGMLSVPTPGFERLSLSVLYDVYYRNQDDKDGSLQSAASGGMMPDYYFYRKDLGIGLRYDVNDNWLVKLEWHELEGADLLTAFFNNNSADKDWDYTIVKTSFNF